MKGQRGFTLVEMLVVLTVMGVTFAAVGLTVRAPAAVASPEGAMAAAQRAAVRSGDPVGIPAVLGDSIWVYPDGSATAGRIVEDGVGWRPDPWTGELSREP